MGVKVTMHKNNIRKLTDCQKKALVQAVDAMVTDLKQSCTMPFNVGTMQNSSTGVDDSRANEGKVSAVTDTPYADRLYHHPEYNFRTNNNANAGADWFEPYIRGSKKSFIKNAYSMRLKALNEVAE